MKPLLPMVLLVAAGCNLGDAESGQSTYQFQCAGCHGMDGKLALAVNGGFDTGGQVTEAGTAADLTVRVPVMTDERILAALHEGKGAMPAQFGDDDTEAYDVLAYLREEFDGPGAAAE